jgi:hypothetical protein
MKTLICFVVLISVTYSVSASNFISDYFKNHYPLVFVESLPSNTHHRILIISSRYFKPEKDYLIKRGIQPRFKLFYFIASLKNDTAFIQPLDQMTKASDYLPSGRDFLVYVDGHGKTFGQTMERGFELTERFNVNMVIFDWPTDYMALRKTVYSADEVAVGFVKAMRSFNTVYSEFYSDSQVSVIFHSMGNRIMKFIAGTRLIKDMPHDLFTNVIINAAAVKQQNHAKWVERMDIQKRIYITSNHNDFNLKGAAVLRLAEQLGLGNKKYAKNAYYVNFSDYATEEHNLFLGKSHLEKSKPELFRFYDLAFHGKEVTFDRATGFQILSPSDKDFLFSVR